MKKILVATGMIILCLSLFSQSPTPYAFKYQGILRDAEGNPLLNDGVTLKLSIRQGGETGTIVYQETHITATNAFGLVNVNVGEGTPVIGSFLSIEWGLDVHYLQVEVNNGGGFLNMGSYQLLSVPYALHAIEAESTGLPEGNENSTLRNVGSGWVPSDFLANDDSHVGVGTTSPTSDLHINSDKFLLNPTLSSDVPFKIIGPSSGFGLFMDQNDIQTVSDRLYLNYWNNNDISLANGGGSVLIGDASTSPESSLIRANPSDKLYAIYATNQSTADFSRVIYAAHTGTSAIDAISIQGYSRPQDGWGIGGFFYGGSRGLEAQSYGTSTLQYYGARLISNGVNTGTNYGSFSTGLYGTYNYGAYGNAISSTGTSNYGICGYASSGSSNYGVYGTTNVVGGSNYGLYCNGNGAYTGTWTDVSDEKFKENIAEFTEALEGIRRLHVYNYNFKTDGEAQYMNLEKGVQTGFLSQELETIFPELVRQDVNVVPMSYDPDPKKPVEHIKIEYKGINYIGMVPYLTQAIKEQQVMIEQMKLEIESLKKMVGELQNR